MKSNNMKHLTKRELLNKFTLSQLKELSKQFNIEVTRTNKKEIIISIEKSRTISKQFLITLLLTKGQTVQEKIKNLRKTFFKDFIEEKIEF